MKRLLVTTVAAVMFSSLGWAPLSLADPSGPPSGPDGPAPGAVDPLPVINPDLIENRSPAASFDVPDQAGNPVADACRLFNAALNVAAVNYEDFAYATAGNGNYVNYRDPNVSRTNVIGRTALRQAAAAALSASQTEGLPLEVSDPIRSWSLRATKLLLVMGLHGGGDTLNSSVAELNVLGREGQMACVSNGARL